MGLLQRRRDRLNRPLDPHELRDEAVHTLALAEAKEPGVRAVADQLNGVGVPWMTIIFAIVQAMLKGESPLELLRKMLEDLFPPKPPATSAAAA